MLAKLTGSPHLALPHFIFQLRTKDLEMQLMQAKFNREIEIAAVEIAKVGSCDSQVLCVLIQCPPYACEGAVLRISPVQWHFVLTALYFDSVRILFPSRLRRTRLRSLLSTGRRKSSEAN
jgi:hypothetical protein